MKDDLYMKKLRHLVYLEVDTYIKSSRNALDQLILLRILCVIFGRAFKQIDKLIENLFCVIGD